MASTDRILGGGNWTKTHAMTDGTVPTLGTTVVFSIAGDIVSANIQRQDTGQYDVSIDHVRDTAVLQTYLDAYINVVTSSAIGEMLFEDGVKEAAASSSNLKQIIFIGGGLIAGTAALARKVFVGPQRLKSSSGSYQQAAETWNHVALEYEGFKLGGALTIGATWFNSVATTPAQVILTTSLPYGTIVYQ